MKMIQLFASIVLLPLSTLADLNSGLVGFYTFDGNGSNSAGPGLNLANHGATYQAGLHGLAASFDGSGQYLKTIEDFPITSNMSRSISVWLKPNAIAGVGNVAGWGIRTDQTTGKGASWDLHLWPPAEGHAWINAAWLVYSSGPAPFTFSFGTWMNLAVTYDGTSNTVTFYLNGTNVGGYFYYSEPGASVNTQPAPLLVGYLSPQDPPGADVWKAPWNGLIEDLKIYDRVLTPEEVTLLARTNWVPIIAAQPHGTVGYWGGSAQFDVQAEGYSELSYLWYKDGFAIPWATNATLNLGNLDFIDAGNYTVVVSDNEGSITSAPPALLVVNPAGVSIGLYPFLTIEGTVGKSFGIQYTTEVSQTNSWLPLTEFTLTQPIQVWIDTNVDASRGHDAKRFYRVVALPSP